MTFFQGKSTLFRAFRPWITSLKTAVFSRDIHRMKCLLLVDLNSLKKPFKLGLRDCTDFFFTFRPAEFLLIYQYLRHQQKPICFLQALFGQSCKTFLDIIASPNWTKLQSLDWQLSCQPHSHCRPYLVVTA